MPLRIGFVGLGNMGARMAANIARSGFPLSVYNRTRSKSEAFARSTDAAIAGSPAELAGACDALITMVSDGAVVEEIYSGPGGVLENMRPGMIGVEMSTIGPEAVLALGSKLEARGGRLVDAPVSGSVAFAESAALTVMAGGSADDVNAVRPVLEAMASKVFHLGPLGAGAAMKLAVNAIVYALNGALSEGLVLSERAGIARAAAYDVFASSAIAAPFVHYRRAAFERPEETPVGSRLALAQKDMDLILALAKGLHLSLPQAETNRDVLQAASESGLAKHDVSAVAEYLRNAGQTRTK
jgi:3-hydroxyisobutyrate dehydrogenase/2-hydroxy-3-oxopropionate reductase